MIDTKQTTETIRIQNKDIPLTRQRVPIAALRLDPSNPRIQYIIGRYVGNVDDAQLDEIVELVRASSIGDHVVSELNFARFFRGIELDRKRRAEDLISELEADQQRLQ